MTAADLLPLLSGVKPRGARGWVACCPAHDDHSPSLSVAEGDRGLLLKCWAGCSLDEITNKLGLKVADLFLFRYAPEFAARRDAIRELAQVRAAQRTAHEAKGRRIDALREADYLVRAAQGLSIDRWTDQELATALDSIGHAWQLLEAEGLQYA